MLFILQESETLDAQNKALKLEISKLESEKNHLMDILQEHEPSCAKKVKESMKVRRQQFEFSNSGGGEFRVPLPPSGPRIPSIQITSPNDPHEDPPSFAEAIRMVSEVKEEEEEIVPDYNIDYNEEFYRYTNAGSNPFLAKRNLGQTYLDLDSRCIAL